MRVTQDMTMDGSASDAATALEELTLTEPEDAAPTKHVPSPDDGATTPGGPTMVLIGTGIYLAVKVWRYRRRRRRQV
ncbi:hypothetical protein [Mycolicibacterium fluoranthenivorans]|uniref:Uncharacterized protein n=1 Tax=Mycolicibacterium fluoranthenivorans TaxID=258505 RepID=A0A7X5ZCH0_9MYCO|nr:hypothetical protein [Mycolicibacterium fluoranthenivorans]MCV7358948.1 hypothetical protein [Mycolicibacterium fluoranthenivorans]NIH95069.1 hypothetical protein [Mycolicibacterium fluoranthenivorans]